MKIFRLTIVAIASVLLAGAIVLQFPKVQTYIVGKVTGSLSEKLDGNISFEKIHFRPFTTLVLKNVAIVDKEPFHSSYNDNPSYIDTLFRAEYIIATFTLEGLFKHEGIHLRKAVVDNAQMNLILEDQEDRGDGDVKTDNLSRIFRIKKPDPDKEQNMKEIFHIRKVEIRDMGFSMKNFQSGRPVYDNDFGIDWNDLDVKDINIRARNLMFKEGKMSGTAERISFVEKSGFRCVNITGEAIVGGGKTIVEDLRIDDGMSDVNMSLFMMSYRNSKSFSDFISAVKLDGQIEASILDFRTLSYFAPELSGNRLRTDIFGTVSGYVDDFSVSDLFIKSHTGSFSGKINGKMTGLPDTDKTYINAKAEKFSINSEGLGHFLSQWMQEGNLDLSRYAADTRFSLDVIASGLLNKLKISASLGSPIGDMQADALLMDILEQESPVSIEGSVRTDELNIGRFINQDIIGETSLKASLKAKIADESSSLRVDSLLISGLYLNGYRYSGIAGAGTLAQKAFNGTIICNDPSLNFMFQGAFALSPKTQNSRYDFYAVVGHADLHAMNIDRRGTSEIQFQTKADFTRTRSGDIFGKIDIADIVAGNDHGKHVIGNINLTSHSNDNIFRARMNSRFADLSYTGSASLSEFIKDLRNITAKKEAPALFKDPAYKWNGNSYDLSLKFHNSMNLLSYAVPGFYIADSTALHASIDSEGLLKAELNSSRIAFQEQYLKGLHITADNESEQLRGEMSCNEIKVANVAIEDNSLQILVDDNHIGAGFRYDNKDELVNRGEFIAVCDISRDDDIVDFGVDILPSGLYLNSREWSILPSRLHLRKNEIDVESIELESGDQRISLKGRTSYREKDTLTLSLDRFDISMVNPLIKNDFNIKGAITGDIKLTSPMESKGLLADLICDSTYIAGLPLGEIAVSSEWDEEFERFNVSLANSLEGKSNIDISGRVTPKLKTLESEISFDRFRVAYMSPLLSDVFSEMDGYISGDITIDGPWNNFSIESRGTRLDDATLRVAYTNVPYKADGTFHLDSYGVYFDDIELSDSYDGFGNVSGSINFDHFRDISFNTRIKATDIECVNLSESQADVFYGNIFATGNIGITGPINSLLLSVDAFTTKTGQLHIPLSLAGSGTSSNNLLKFKEVKSEVYIDPYEMMITRMKTKKADDSDLGLKLKVNASPSLEAFVEIDKASGNVLSGRGSGMIDLEVGKDIFNINGDYTLNSGSYRFNAAGIASRDFEIQDGSSIRFNGDIMESTLNIDAIYKTKTSLSTLISDTTSVSNRRTVECGILISDKLSDPRLKFTIEIPDLDPTIKSRVESALSSEDKVQRQFLSLIITNSFLPDEQSGIVNNSSMLYSSFTEIMSTQLNNIFQKLDIPVDLGMKYQPNERGTDIFDVAVSTQLFNNRVVVNGNIGNKQQTSSSQNGVVGDLDIEIKLDRSGAIRLNIFSHSADQYTNFLDNSQRNGVGLTYQTEFSNFRRFIRNIFMSREKRRQSRFDEEQAMLEEGRNVLEIEKNSNNDRSKR